VICSQTSVFVAACEAVMGRHLQGINRRPGSDADRAANINEVIWQVAHLLKTDLNHISGQRIALGDMHDIFNLVEIMAALSYLRPAKGAAESPPPVVGSEPAEASAADASANMSDSMGKPFDVKVRRSGRSSGKSKRAPGSGPDRKVMRDAVQTIAALGNELSDLETSVYGRRKTKPQRLPEPSRPLSEYIRPPEAAPIQPRRPPRAGQAKPMAFRPPRLRTAMREQERYDNRMSKAKRNMVGQPLQAYTRADMNRELRKRAEAAAEEERAADPAAAEERRQRRLAQIVSERAEADAMLSEYDEAGPPELRPVVGGKTTYTKLRRQSKKVKLAYGSMVNRYSGVYHRMSTAAAWHRANHKHAKNKLPCPYPEVALHDGDKEDGGVLESGPGAPDWKAPETVLTGAMREKLAGLQRMQDRGKPTKQARRVMSLRQVEESWRQAARKEIWMRQHWAERRKALRDSERDLALAARSDGYTRKVEGLREAQARKDAASQRRSRKLRHANRDRRILKEMFQQAVELEKEKILDGVKTQKTDSAARAAKEGRSGQTSHGSYLEQQVQENWAHLSQVLSSERQQRNAVEHQQDQLLRAMDRERRELAKQQRHEALARLADAEEAAYWHAAHPKHEGAWFHSIWHSAAQYKA